MIRGYHEYKDIWEATKGEELLCRRENDNYHDPFSVSVVKEDRIVGHVPKKISTVCLLFLRRGGSIVCVVTGHRRYSQDLPQGGLEIPCTLSFSGESTYIEKAKHCLLSVSAEISVHVNSSANTKENSKAVNATAVSKEKAEVVCIAKTDELMP